MNRSLTELNLVVRSMERLFEKLEERIVQLEEQISVLAAGESDEEQER